MKQQRCFLFISTLAHIPWGGCEDLWYKTALLALEEGHKVVAIIFRHEEIPPHLQILEERGADLVFLTRPHTPASVLSRVRNKIKPASIHRKTLLQLQQVIDRWQNITILISQAGGFDFAYPYLEELREWLHGRKYEVVVHNVPDLGFTLKREAAKKQAQVFNQASSVYFVARRNKISSERILATGISNAAFINNPLNFSTLPCCLPFPSLNGKVQFAVVAALRCFHKGQDILLQVLGNEVWKSRDWQLNLYGKGPDKEYLQTLADFYRIGHRVAFHGHATDIIEIWRSNHMHILPSLGEGTPLALIESMYCGRPAITTDVGGNTEYCNHLVNGFVADYPTPNALARVMEQAWLQKADWERMGLNARNVVCDRYNLYPEKMLVENLGN